MLQDQLLLKDLDQIADVDFFIAVEQILGIRTESAITAKYFRQHMQHTVGWKLPPEQLEFRFVHMIVAAGKVTSLIEMADRIVVFPTQRFLSIEPAARRRMKCAGC